MATETFDPPYVTEQNALNVPLVVTVAITILLFVTFVAIALWKHWRRR